MANDGGKSCTATSWPNWEVEEDEYNKNLEHTLNLLIEKKVSRMENL